jgi:uncharacterized protein YkwD
MNSPKLISQTNKVLMVAISLAILTNFSLANAASNTSSDPITHQGIVSLTNQDRLGAGDSLLIEDSQLDTAAMAKARDMVANNYFDHYSPQGATPWDFILSSGYDYQLAGENLAMDFATSHGVNNAWLNSPTHRKNILNPEYNNIGVAVLEGQINGHETTLVVQMFGSTHTSILDNLDIPLVKTVSNLLGL